MDRRGVSRTTYQMRNPFRQFADGVATELDAHCYAQHAMAADLCPKGGRVLDVCCGRGLLIPFLRYRASPSLYCGVDAEPGNARWRDGADPRRESERKDWPFRTVFVQADAALMTGPVRDAVGEGFGLVVYTSSIEHMQPEFQAESLARCAELAVPGAILFLSCPVTEEGASGYDARYAAHVYEPREAEVLAWADAAGWSLDRTIGLCTGARAFRERLSGSDLAQAERVYRSMPRAFSLVCVAALFPSCATEKAYVMALRGGLF